MAALGHPAVLKLRNREIAVPEDGEGRNFRYFHRETGHWSVAFDWFTWQERIKLHRKANDLPPVTVEETEDQLCRGLPPEQCLRDAGDAPGINPKFGWEEFVAGTKAFLKVMFTGFVPQEEANRRARICANCYFNVGLAGCGTCRKMGEIITGDVANKRTDYDAQLKACAACKCSVPAMIWFPLETLGIEEKQERLAPFCWQRSGSENFIPA